MKQVQIHCVTAGGSEHLSSCCSLPVQRPMGLILQPIYNAKSNYVQASFVYYAAKHTTDGCGFHSAVHKVSLKAVQPCAELS